jgi:large subunit ribosomal protein L25
MDTISLTARTRTETGRHVHALRREGDVPAVLYGHKIDPVSLAVEAKALERTWLRAGRTHLVDVKVDGGKAHRALIKSVQFHPRTGRALHVDFFAVNLREKISADVPVIVVGDSPAVQQKLGQVQQVVSSLRVEALPADLPAQITVDVSGLMEVDQSITLGQLDIPKGAALVHTELDEVVVKIAAVRVREEEAAVGAAAEEESPSPASPQAQGEAGEGEG